MTNSREIAIKYEKRHKSILRTIDRITKKNPELSRYFMRSSYISKDGRRLKQYDIDNSSLQLFKKMKYKLNLL